MRRVLASSLLTVIVMSLLLPSSSPSGVVCDENIAVIPPPVLYGEVTSEPWGAVDVISGINTSRNITEYPFGARALMLPGGSVDSAVGDLNDDGQTDLVVAVHDTKSLSIFYRDSEGLLPSYPSHNITLPRSPVQVEVHDLLGTGELLIAVLERRNTVSDSDYLAVYSRSGDFSYDRDFEEYVYTNASAFVIGEFSGDSNIDIAVTSGGPNPSTQNGRLQLYTGPLYDPDVIPSVCGKGSGPICAGDYNNDGGADIAVSNYYDSTVMVFYHPLTDSMSPDLLIDTVDSPTDIRSGLLDADALTDLVVCTEDSDALRFYMQDTQLPEETTYIRDLDTAPNSLAVGDVTGDGKVDIVVLHEDSSKASCFVQSTAAWPDLPDMVFPTGAMPKDALVADVDGAPSVEVVMSTARSDWSGSSVALYRYEDGHLSNSNLTVWTDDNYEASGMALGDLDGDEQQDLVLIYPDLKSISCRLGMSGEPHSTDIGYTAQGLLLADVNGDGEQELITTNRTRAIVDVRYAIDLLTGSFDVEELVCTANVTSVDVGDLNGDGFLDVVASTVNGSVELFINSGSYSTPCFDAAQVLFPTPYEELYCLVVGDFDWDGDDDIAYSRTSRTIEVLLQHSGSIDLPADYEMTVSTGDDFEQLWAGDVNGDERTDLVAARPSDSSLYMYDQVDFPGSAHPDLLEFPEAPSFTSVTDVTDDGKPDVLAIFESADILFLYKQTDSFIDSVPDMVFVTGGNPNSALFGDGTGDHRADLLVLDSTSHSVSIWEQNNFPPIADAGGPYITGQGDAHVLNGSAVTGWSELPFMEYKWMFGDGEQQDWARDPNPVHRYMELGEFTVEMWVRDPAGLTDYDSSYVSVIDSVPHVEFSWTPLNPTEGQTVLFESLTESYDPVVALLWYVDEELVSFGLEETLTWEFDDGIHFITLTANDSDGSSVTKAHSLSIQALDPEIELVCPESVDEGDLVQLSVSVDPWHDGPVDEIVSVEWNFSYDGEEFVADVDTGSSTSTSHVFGASGDFEVYVVAVRVTDADGDWNLTSRNVQVFDIGPSAAIALSDPVPSEGVPFSFVDATYTYDGVVDWSWELTYPGGSSDTWDLDASSMAAIEFELADGSYVMQLDVSESDGDQDSHVLEFEVAEIPPMVTLMVVPAAESYHEFETVSFSAAVESYDPVVGFEWDFVSLGAQFESDRDTEQNETLYAYNWVGNYTAKVRVTDDDGSSAVQQVDVQIVDTELEGDFETDIDVRRENPNRTCEVTFDASALAERYPDIFSGVWHFGDGDLEILLDPPVEPITHVYDPIRNYEVNVTLADDDGNLLTLATTLRLVEPFVELINPMNGSVVRSGTPVRFIITDDSPPLVSVEYSLNGGPFSSFETLYSVDTTGWGDGLYSLTVRAEDRDGNIAIERDVQITIDDLDPVVSLTWQRELVYGGDKVNISIQVNDSNLGDGSVVLFVTFPGDDSESRILMKQAGDGLYYAVVEMPKRSGTLEFYVHVEDLAGNSATSETFTMQVKLHFIDAAWPYLLTIALMAALGMAAYFFREERIAVDETFVIYEDGRMLGHSTRRLKPGMDDQVLSSMLVAVQDFVRDSFKDETSFTLRKMEFGDRSILVEKGEHLFLAVVLHGSASRKVARRMKSVLDEMEEQFSSVLTDWDGDLDKVRGVNDNVKRLYSRAPLLPELPKLRNN